MKVLQIMGKISEGKNIIFYNKSVYDCYNKLKDNHICIYFNEPTPVKVRLIKIINELSDDNKLSLNRLTITELKDILVKELHYERLVITFNHFERLTKRTVQVYQNLNSLSNIQFICSFSQDFKPEVYPFYKQFELVNQKEYEEKGVKNEINVTYALYIILSIYCFFIYLKTASSPYTPFILIGAAWFALIIFRTLVYIGGR
jgi:hypothetical protein